MRAAQVAIEELGIDPNALGSPLRAAISSFFLACFVSMTEER